MISSNINTLPSAFNPTLNTLTISIILHSFVAVLSFKHDCKTCKQQLAPCIINVFANNMYVS